VLHKVSCIMPTANRRKFVPLAIRQFQSQSYPNRELIILDDGDESVEDLIPCDPNIRYRRISGRNTVGMKRNLACEDAEGEIIVHWDDDDMMSPERISYQTAALCREEVDLCGVARILFFGPTPDEAWQYAYPEDEPPWVYGGSFCYWKQLWHRNPFPDIDVGEDNTFAWSDCAKTIAALEDNRFYIGLIHSANTSPKNTADPRWSRLPATVIHETMPGSWEQHAAILARLSDHDRFASTTSDPTCSRTVHP
jgi:glycosyltransferase involved in cell wall biosynthesis